MNPFDRTTRHPLAESKLTPETSVLAPASAVLQRLLDDAADQFTLAWLLGHLRKRSLGLIMLLLALVAMLPGISYVAGLLLATLKPYRALGNPPSPRRVPVDRWTVATGTISNPSVRSLVLSNRRGRLCEMRALAIDDNLRVINIECQKRVVDLPTILVEIENCFAVVL